MPALSKSNAVEKLAVAVEKSKLTTLVEVFAELFPDRSLSTPPSASDLAQHVRCGLEAEEVVDLWNVVFPHDHNVWYDEGQDEIHYNDELSYLDVG